MTDSDRGSGAGRALELTGLLSLVGVLALAAVALWTQGLLSGLPTRLLAAGTGLGLLLAAGVSAVRLGEPQIRSNAVVLGLALLLGVACYVAAHIAGATHESDVLGIAAGFGLLALTVPMEHARQQPMFAAVLVAIALLGFGMALLQQGFATVPPALATVFALVSLRQALAEERAPAAPEQGTAGAMGTAPQAPRPQPAAPRASGENLEHLRRELARYQEIERQLRQAKQDAESATMAKGEFLATMSHEIRTPLNGIIPLLDILLSTKLAPDQHDYATTAYQSAKQLLSIVDDILDYSKIEANKLELETVGINLREIVDSVARLMLRNAAAKGLKFGAVIEPSVRLAMRGDPVRLRQVLTNLVSNAIKFTERGEIEVRVSKRGETRSSAELVFSVRDTGVGISKETQAKLFNPFTQADASTTRIHGGTGLGLVICRRLVELMGGQIGVKSEAGKGSTFWFSVPLLKALGDIAAARQDLNGSRALVVTSDPIQLRRVSLALNHFGVTFTQNSISAEALAKLRSASNMGETWAFDFLVLDYGAMRNSALVLARTVLKETNLDRLHIAVLAGDEEIPEELRKSPRLAVLPRLITEPEFRKALLDLLAGGAMAEGGLPTVDSLVPAPVAAADGFGEAPPPSPSQPAAPPRAPESSPGLEQVEHAGAARRGIGGHVLLVEDNPVNRQVAQRLLSLVGVSFDLAEHGKQALERLDAGQYDAVLLDCQMPIMDGYQTARTIRKLEADGVRTKRIPVVAMTANAMAGDREKCLAAGMDDYMSKPLNRALLEQMLQRWLPSGARSRAQPEGAPKPAAPAIPRPVSDAPRVESTAVNQEIVQDLIEMMGGEFTDLVRVYLEDTPRSVELLERAAGLGDNDGLVAPSHSLKSTSANLGALGLSEMAKRIEHGARSHSLSGDPVLLVAQLKGEYERVETELKRLLTGVQA